MSLIDRLKKEFGEAIVDVDLDAIDPWFEVSPDGLRDVSVFLKQENDLRFNMLNSITVVDYLHTDPKKAAKADWEPHLEVVYHLSSIATKHTVVMKVKLPRWKDDEEGQLPELPSLMDIWPAADWHEREAYDLSGVRFVGHADLRRILCPEDWIGHPLRKDYEMPLEYHGMRGR